MAYRCEVCGKEPWTGKQVSFSHKRSSRRWLPNIQRVRVKHGSNSRRMRVCTSCLKAGKVEKVYPSPDPATHAADVLSDL